MHSRGGFQYYRCVGCDLEVTDPLPTDEMISQYYTSRRTGDAYHTRVTYERHDDVHQRIAKWAIGLHGRVPKTVLDVGCLEGRLLDCFKQLGAETYGIEIQRDAVGIANAKHGGRIFEGVIEGFLEAHPEQRFELVTAVGVIEHVRDPAEFLKAIRRLITRDGLLILQTPNTGSRIRKVMQGAWPPYVPVEHIYLFSAANLSRLLDACGFQTRISMRHWKRLEVEFFYRQTQVFMPYLYNVLRHVMPLMPASIRRLRVPLYSGEMLVAADPVSGYKRNLDGAGNYWLYS